MPDELATQLRDLLNVRALIGEESHEHSLAELQTAYGSAYVIEMLHMLLSHEQSNIDQAQQIGGAAQVGVAVVGNIYGAITVGDSMMPDTTELVRGYCEVVRHRYQDATLPSVPEPQAPSRNFRINLEQVYLHVATTMLTERETFDRVELKTLDMQEFIDTHLSMAGRLYPWGADIPDDERANFGDRYGTSTAVGCFALGATSEGVYDLGGNVWEWTRSHFTAYPYDPEDGREATAHPERAKFVARGAGWHSRAIRLRAATRNVNAPDNHFNDLGFRVCQLVSATLATAPRETEKLST